MSRTSGSWIANPGPLAPNSGITVRITRAIPGLSPSAIGRIVQRDLSVLMADVGLARAREADRAEALHVRAGVDAAAGAAGLHVDDVEARGPALRRRQRIAAEPVGDDGVVGDRVQRDAHRELPV